MEIKKSREADLERRRSRLFLLGLVCTLSLLFVAMEWNGIGGLWGMFEPAGDLTAEIELSPLKRADDQTPMMLPQEKTHEQKPQADELRVVDEQVEPDAELPAEMPEQTAPVEAEAADEAVENEVVDMYEPPVDIEAVENLPQFPGGAVELMKWLTKNLKYPAQAQQRKVKGRVLAQFVVNKDGTVSDLQLLERLDPLCDREVLRVLRMMPQWQPGKIHEQPCRTQVTLPVVFNL